MKRLVFAILLAAAVLLPAATLAQDAPKTSDVPPAPQRARSLAAFVSADGSSFLDTHHSQWLVANPASLSPFRNQRVKLKFLLTSRPNYAQVLSVKLLPVYVRTSPNPSDSAFRR